MITCTICAIGSELIEGSIVDTNSSFVAKAITKIGVDVREIRLLPDDKLLISHVIKELSLINDLIITTGGLGPTFDDLTAECIALATGRQLLFNEQVFLDIKKKLFGKKIPIKKAHERQALLPDDAVLFNNDVGTACGFGVFFNKAFICSMPGIPYEMRPMFENYILPFIKNKFHIQEYFSKEIYFMGVAESDVDEAIRTVGMDSEVKTIINVSKGYVIVRLRSNNEFKLKALSDNISSHLHKYFLGVDDERLETLLVEKLKEKNITIAAAESCSGGLLGTMITSIPGSSQVFNGGLVVYSNEVKMQLLGIDEKVLRNYGAVSNECASDMAKNVKNIFRTKGSISITGVAGPSGGTKDKPVGTVFIGVSLNDTTSVKKFKFTGDRDAVRQRSVNAAMWMLLKKLHGI